MNITPTTVKELFTFFSFVRGDMTKPYHYYECEPIRRTLREVVEMPKITRGENYCCVHQPLLMLPHDHIILDSYISCYALLIFLLVISLRMLCNGMKKIRLKKGECVQGGAFEETG